MAFFARVAQIGDHKPKVEHKREQPVDAFGLPQ
jgi:hypothetical protein